MPAHELRTSIPGSGFVRGDGLVVQVAVQVGCKFTYRGIALQRDGGQRPREDVVEITAQPAAQGRRRFTAVARSIARVGTVDRVSGALAGTRGPDTLGGTQAMHGQPRAGVA